MAEIQIIGWERGFSADPNRQGRFDRYVTYVREDKSVGFVPVPDETFTPAAAQAAIRKAEAERQLGTPLKFTV